MGILSDALFIDHQDRLRSSSEAPTPQPAPRTKLRGGAPAPASLAAKSGGGGSAWHRPAGPHDASPEQSSFGGSAEGLSALPGASGTPAAAAAAAMLMRDFPESEYYKEPSPGGGKHHNRGSRNGETTPRSGAQHGRTPRGGGHLGTMSGVAAGGEPGSAHRGLGTLSGPPRLANGGADGAFAATPAGSYASRRGDLGPFATPDGGGAAAGLTPGLPPRISTLSAHSGVRMAQLVPISPHAGGGGGGIWTPTGAAAAAAESPFVAATLAALDGQDGGQLRQRMDNDSQRSRNSETSGVTVAGNGGARAVASASVALAVSWTLHALWRRQQQELLRRAADGALAAAGEPALRVFGLQLNLPGPARTPRGPAVDSQQGPAALNDAALVAAPYFYRDVDGGKLARAEEFGIVFTEKQLQQQAAQQQARQQLEEGAKGGEKAGRRRRRSRSRDRGKAGAGPSSNAAAVQASPRDHRRGGGGGGAGGRQAGRGGREESRSRQQNRARASAARG